MRAGISEVIDGGQQVIVLFSAVNPMKHAILLVPPQVELGGQIRRGKIFRHSEWTSSEELAVEAFRLSRRRLGPGERADGVVMFKRPPYKQSNETLFLQVAEAGAIDKPALLRELARVAPAFFVEVTRVNFIFALVQVCDVRREPELPDILLLLGDRAHVVLHMASGEGIGHLVEFGVPGFLV